VSLSNLASRFGDLNEHNSALRPAEEAEELYRKLAAQQPDAFGPGLAGSLNNLAIRLKAVGRREDSLKAAQEAVNLYRELAERRPDVFTTDLAMSLTTLAQCTEGDSSNEESLRLFHEALRTIAPDFLSSPTSFARLTDGIGKDYLRLCKKLAREPDLSLLAQIAEKMRPLGAGQWLNSWSSPHP
jgi:tetratricopeptide (TPR) repeat protein